MKKLFAVLAVIVLCMGCDNDSGFQVPFCVEMVGKAFPHATIVPIPENNFNMLVLNKDGTVIYVSTGCSVNDVPHIKSMVNIPGIIAFHVADTTSIKK